MRRTVKDQTQSQKIMMKRLFSSCSEEGTGFKKALRRGACVFRLPVAHVVSTGVVDFDDNKHMLEMGADVFRGERKGSGLLEYYGDDVVANVPLP